LALPAENLLRDIQDWTLIIIIVEIPVTGFANTDRGKEHCWIEILHFIWGKPLVV